MAIRSNTMPPLPRADFINVAVAFFGISVNGLDQSVISHIPPIKQIIDGIKTA
ncbi:hypothetical protein SPONL_1007 [uncultured Candidatus Thioglobus sp.]|nr:hypothetical protein SPONL_1007 [uncultured Candidatus Thioglobus sp.]